jgi:ribose/xylose/arabinose/galactoside ABC-type transport system permease subunit
MTAPATPASRAPLTIPLADGPVAAWIDRSAALSVASTVAAVVVALWRVAPDPRGHGTHEQLGLDPCGWPIAYGIPCPTCGVTTAACHLVHGNVVTAIAVQPFGAALMLVSLLLGLHALLCLWRRRSFADLLVRLPMWRLLGAAFAGLLATWGYKCLVFGA